MARRLRDACFRMPLNAIRILDRLGEEEFFKFKNLKLCRRTEHSNSFYTDARFHDSKR